MLPGWSINVLFSLLPPGHLSQKEYKNVPQLGWGRMCPDLDTELGGVWWGYSVLSGKVEERLSLCNIWKQDRVLNKSKPSKFVLQTEATFLRRGIWGCCSYFYGSLWHFWILFLFILYWFLSSLVLTMFPTLLIHYPTKFSYLSMCWVLLCPLPR